MPDGTDLAFTIHPAAEAFPMMPEDELQALADSIKANGQFNPIMLSTDGTELIDGRNRLAACGLAGVEPKFARLAKGIDPCGYVVSANIFRRHISKGQKALALALIYREGERGRGKVDPVREHLKGGDSPSFYRVKEARQIIKHPDLIEQVKAGILPFDYALKQATERSTVQQNAEQIMATLQAEAPNIAVMVSEERLNLQEAWAAFQQRKSDEVLAEREVRETYLRIIATAYHSLTTLDNASFATGLHERLEDTGFRGALLERLRLEGKLKDTGPGYAELGKVLRKVFK